MSEARPSSFAEECSHAQESAGRRRRSVSDDAAPEAPGVRRVERRHGLQRPGGAGGAGGGRLQRPDHRPADARHGGHGPDPRGRPAAGAGHDDRDDGVRLDRPGGRGDAARGIRLPDQADRPDLPEAGHGPGARRSGPCRTRSCGSASSSRRITASTTSSARTRRCTRSSS